MFTTILINNNFYKDNWIIITFIWSVDRWYILTFSISNSNINLINWNIDYYYTSQYSRLAINLLKNIVTTSINYTIIIINPTVLDTINKEDILLSLKILYMKNYLCLIVNPNNKYKLKSRLLIRQYDSLFWAIVYFNSFAYKLLINDLVNPKKYYEQLKYIHSSIIKTEHYIHKNITQDKYIEYHEYEALIETTKEYIDWVVAQYRHKL